MTNIPVSMARKNKCTWCWQFVDMPNQAFCSDECRHAFSKSPSCYLCGNPIEQTRKGQPSCRECELISSNSSYCCLAGKAAAIAELYTHRYRESLLLVDWSEDELEEMGKNMRSTIGKSLQDKYLIEARLAHLSFKSKVHTCENG